MSEIIFEVREDETEGGYVATAPGHAIATQGETLENCGRWCPFSLVPEHK